ncbi:hypothetical protein ACF06Q_08225 [Streptomyces leeuwenhoekii]|uniref:hypothetical protein n=1 Tax=Streptomyces leeuwenhoekii TaxID=1437453 RepID=UPI0036FEC4DE
MRRAEDEDVDLDASARGEMVSLERAVLAGGGGEVAWCQRARTVVRSASARRLLTTN